MFTCDTRTFNGDLKLRIVGRGDGGPGTQIVNAWVFLTTPFEVGATPVQLWKDGALADAVARSAPSDRLRVYAREAEDLIARPDLRDFLRQHL